MTTSFWLSAPREGFAARCCAYFDTDFDSADTFKVTSAMIPDRPAKKVPTIYPTAHDALSGHQSRGANTRRSQRAIEKKGGFLS